MLSTSGRLQGPCRATNASKRKTVCRRRVIDASAVSGRLAAASLSRDTLRSGPFTAGRALATKKVPNRTSTAPAK
jgi:hypothetical protein